MCAGVMLGLSIVEYSRLFRIEFRSIDSKSQKSPQMQRSRLHPYRWLPNLAMPIFCKPLKICAWLKRTVKCIFVALKGTEEKVSKTHDKKCKLCCKLWTSKLAEQPPPSAPQSEPPAPQPAVNANGKSTRILPMLKIVVWFSLYSWHCVSVNLIEDLDYNFPFSYISIVYSKCHNNHRVSVQMENSNVISILWASHCKLLKNITKTGLK